MNDNKYIEFKTDNLQAFHIALKVIFDNLACLYVIRKLQSENFKLQSLDEERFRNPEKFHLNFDKYIDSISVEMNFGKLHNNDRILVKSDITNRYGFAMTNDVKD